MWASEATRNGPDSILIAPLNELGMPGEVEHIELKGHPLPTGIAFAADGKTAYVAFSRNNTLAVIDTATRKIREEIEVGMAPFGVVVSGGPRLRDQPRRTPSGRRTIRWLPRAAPDR